MQRAWIVVVAVGMAWGCHPDHRRKPKDPKLVLDPDAELEDWTAQVTLDNACADVVDLVASTTRSPGDDAVHLSITPGETLVWTFASDEKLWHLDVDGAAIEAVVDDDGTDVQVTFDCSG
jgi:hypothetical protein